MQGNLNDQPARNKLHPTQVRLQEVWQEKFLKEVQITQQTDGPRQGRNVQKSFSTSMQKVKDPQFSKNSTTKKKAT